MAPIPLAFIPAPGSAQEHEAPSMEATECLLAPTPVTDGAGRALVLYQRMIESGFDGALVMTGT